MTHKFLKNNDLRLEIYAATGLFPVAVARRIGTFPTADFLRHAGLFHILGFVLVGGLFDHRGSMPDTARRRMGARRGNANGYNPVP